MPKQVFKCEKCNNEFDTRNKCVEHEIECFNKQDTVNINLEKAIKQLQSKYDVSFKNYEANIYLFDDYDGFDDERISIRIEGTLSNTHEIDYYNCSWNLNTIHSDDFYRFIEKELIIPYLSTTYSGTVYRDVFDNYTLIGQTEIEITEIMRRLNGKEIKIEIINN